MAGALVKAAITFMRGGKQVTQMRMVKPETAAKAGASSVAQSVNGKFGKLIDGMNQSQIVALGRNMHSQGTKMATQPGVFSSVGKTAQADGKQLIQHARGMKPVTPSAAARKASVENSTSRMRPDGTFRPLRGAKATPAKATPRIPSRTLERYDRVIGGKPPPGMTAHEAEQSVLRAGRVADKNKADRAARATPSNKQSR